MAREQYIMIIFFRHSINYLLLFSNNQSDLISLSCIKAPANLRYGDASTNSAIGESMDPMGTNIWRKTGDEDNWYSLASYKPAVYQFLPTGDYLVSVDGFHGNIYVFSSFIFNGRIYEDQENNRIPFDPTQGVALLMSSTGEFGHRTLNANRVPIPVWKNRYFINRF